MQVSNTAYIIIKEYMYSERWCRTASGDSGRDVTLLQNNQNRYYSGRAHYFWLLSGIRYILRFSIKTTDIVEIDVLPGRLVPQANPKCSSVANWIKISQINILHKAVLKLHTKF